jgi:NADPH2:quinone reductase
LNRRVLRQQHTAFESNLLAVVSRAKRLLAVRESARSTPSMSEPSLSPEVAMKHQRIVVARYGGPEELQLIDEDVPEPGTGQVRVKVLAVGVAMPDVMAREGLHPETPRVPYTPGWDFVGRVDALGAGVGGLALGQPVAAMPISGSYAEFVCVEAAELLPIPEGLDPAETVGLLLNYITAYQMLHRCAHASAGQRVLIHGASGGVGTALLQLGRLCGLTLLGTCSSRGAQAVIDLGGTPIDYRREDLHQEVLRQSAGGVDAVFDPFGGRHLWESRADLREGGRVVAYGTTTSLREEGLGAKRRGRRNPLHGIPVFGLYILGGLLLPGRRRIVPYSIQWFKRLRPALFRRDFSTLLELLRARLISPVIAARLPLSQARQAHELLSRGGVVGKIVLIPGAA